MAGVNANFQFGLLTTVGTAAQSKSYAYDEAQYIQTDPVTFTLANAGTGTASQQNSSVALVSAFNKQLRSVTAIPFQVAGQSTSSAVQATGGDYFQIYLISAYAQAFGTATGPAYFVGSNTSGTFYGSSTNTGTNANVVQIFNVMTFMTGQAGGVKGTALASGTCGLTPQTAQLSGGTFTVVVANGVGTNTQTNYVFPIGPNGGLSIQPGDVLIVAKGTDTLMTYVGELELTYTPGGLVTR